MIKSIYNYLKKSSRNTLRFINCALRYYYFLRQRELSPWVTRVIRIRVKFYRPNSYGTQLTAALLNTDEVTLH